MSDAKQFVTKGKPTTVGAKNIIMYGDTGLGKSTNAVEFAKFMYEQYRKPINLVTAEPSSLLMFEPLRDVGVVNVAYLPAFESPLVAMKLLRQGSWPLPSGKWQSKIDVCAYVIEGLTSISELLLEELRSRGLLLREQKSDAFEIDGQTFSPSSQSAYGFVQNELLAALKDFSALDVQRVLWTGHEAKGKDFDTGMNIIGPALVGSAKTAQLQKYCSLLLHAENYPVKLTLNTKDKDVRDTDKPLTYVDNRVRVWFTRHTDLNNPAITYPAKTTVPPELLAKLHAKYPDRNFMPKIVDGKLVDHLGDFLAVEQQLLVGTTDELRTWKDALEPEATNVAK